MASVDWHLRHRTPPMEAITHPATAAWGDHTQNIYRQGGGGGEMGWNSSSPYEQGHRRSSGGSGYGSPSPRGGGQSSWSYGGGGGYDEQWSNQQSPWRTQSGELTFCVLYHTHTLSLSLSLPLPVLGILVIQHDMTV